MGFYCIEKFMRNTMPSPHFEGAERTPANTGVCDIAWFYYSMFIGLRGDFVQIAMVNTLVSYFVTTCQDIIVSSCRVCKVGNLICLLLHIIAMIV